jgi:prepilin-type processing-associated H-X9-DG protein
MIPNLSGLGLFIELAYLGTYELPTMGKSTNVYHFLNSAGSKERYGWRHSNGMNVMYGDLSIRWAHWTAPYPYGVPMDTIMYWQNGVAVP